MRLVTPRRKVCQRFTAAVSLAATVALLTTGSALLVTGGRGTASSTGSARWSRLFSACGVPCSCQTGVKQGAAEAVGDNDQERQLVCGGPGRVLPVPASLAAAEAAMARQPAEELARWRKRGGFTRGDFEAAVRRLGISHANDVHQVVEIRNNQVRFPLRNDPNSCEAGCNYMVASIARGLNRGLELGKIKAKEGIPMIWTVQDEGVCWDENGRTGCPAPVFSVIRHKLKQYDVLMPVFTEPTTPIYVPWAKKLELAWFRGTPFCSAHPLNGALSQEGEIPCSRLVIASLAQNHSDLINATLNQAVKEANIAGLPGRGLTYEEQAAYKYIIGLDGITASRRLAAILGTNSVVLKQSSSWVEWYYSALQPCQHFLEFWRHNTSDIVQLVQTLKGSRANDGVARAIAANAQAFAVAHLLEEGRWRYWQKLLDEYAELYLGGDPDDPPSNNQTVLMTPCWRCEMLDESGQALPKEVQAKLKRGKRGNGPLDDLHPAS